MVRKLLFVAAVLGLLVGMSSVALAQAETETITVQDFTETFSDVDSCTGVPGEITVTYNGVFHVSEDPNGGVHVTATQTGTVQFIPDDASLPSYSGRFTGWFGGNVTSNGEGFWVTFRVNASGSDGSTEVLNAVEQVHFSNGVLHVEFFKLNCRS